METEGRVFAHGPGPLIVATLERAKEHAAADAVRTGEPQAVVVVDLDHPDRKNEILGYVYADGSYREAVATSVG